MRHGVDTRRLGRYTSHRLAMLSNMTASLIMEEMFLPPETEGAEMLQGDAASLADQIIRIIREKGVGL